LRTVIALFPACAQGGGTGHAQMSRKALRCLGREGVAPAGEEFLFVLAKDIGGFQPRGQTLATPRRRKRSMGWSCRASKGLRTALQSLDRKRFR